MTATFAQKARTIRNRAHGIFETKHYDRTPKHGTIGEYSNHGCRCDACRETGLAYHRAYGRRRRAALAATGGGDAVPEPSDDR